MTPHEAAITAQVAGISVLPPAQDGTKRPDAATWTQYQRQAADQDQINRWYSNGRTGVGWVTGQVSGGLEVIDFDDRSAWAEYKALCIDAGLEPLLTKVRNGYFEHTPNGAHLAYRCAEIEGNKKLAKGANKKALIETRGEGGFIIVAPSHGSVNAKGEYTLETGGPDTIVTITPAERQALHDIAKMLDETIAPSDQFIGCSLPGGRPGDEYNSKASWDDILIPHGWAKVSSRLGVVSWRRPGKKLGISATTNHAGSDLLYVFSTSTCFESERGYNKFSAYTLLNHGGDFKEASRELALQGFGQRVEIPEVDLSGIMAQARSEPTTPGIEDLLRVPGLVGELAEWINRSSIKPQPILALGASIAAVSTVLGRKVQTKTGLRPNVYILGVGETGCGKERARQALRSLYYEIGGEDMIGTSFASDSAVETAVLQSPACLYLIDEMGLFLAAIKSEKSPAYIQATLRMLLNMYEESQSFFKRRTFADSKRNEGENTIEQPCLSIYGTTVPSNLYTSLTKEHASDGFLSRLLVFESQNPEPLEQSPDKEARAVPQNLIDGFTRWVKAPINPYTDKDLEALRPDPLVVNATKRGWAVFDDLSARMREKRIAIRKVGDDPGPYTRVAATAQKLALIRACGIKEEPEITEADAQWGCDLALLLTENFLARVGDQVAENKQEVACNRVYSIIRDGSPMAKKDLSRKTQWLTRFTRQDIINTLEESGRITVSVGKPTTYSVV